MIIVNDFYDKRERRIKFYCWKIQGRGKRTYLIVENAYYALREKDAQEKDLNTILKMGIMSLMRLSYLGSPVILLHSTSIFFLGWK